MKIHARVSLFVLLMFYAVFAQSQTQGPRGFTGARGPAGSVTLGTVTTGDPGTSAQFQNVGTSSVAVFNITIPRGSVLYSGTSSPSNTLGGNMDYYFNSTTGCFYGPKASGAWPGSCKSLVGPTGPAGTNGTNGANGVASLPQLATQHVRESVGALSAVDPSKVQNGNYLNPNGAGLSQAQNVAVTALSICNSGGSMVTATPFYGNGAIAAVAFYDQADVYIAGSDVLSNVATGGTFSCPSTAAYFRATLDLGVGVANIDPTRQAGVIAQAGVYAGSALPNPQPGFAPASLAIANSLIAYSAATSASLIGSKVTGIAGGIAAASGNVLAALGAPSRPNRYNLVTNTLHATTTADGITTASSFDSNIGIVKLYVAECTSHVVTSNFRVGFGTGAGGGPTVYLDASNTAISSAAIDIDAGNPITFPAGTVTLVTNAYFNGAGGSPYPLNTQTGMAMCGPDAIPSNYVPFTFLTAHIRPDLYGQSYAVFADSIWSQTYNYQPENIISAYLGMTAHLIDARFGRTINQIFEHYGAADNSGTPGVNGTVVTAPNGSSIPNTGTPGNTVTQDLAGITRGIVALGTNQTSAGVPLGTPTDGPTALTTYGGLENAMSYIDAHAPQGSRWAWMGMYKVSTSYTADDQRSAINAAIKYKCMQHSWTYIDADNDSGINPTTAAWLLRDGIHPTDGVGYNFFGGWVATQLAFRAW